MFIISNNMSAIEIMFLTEYVKAKESICNRDDYESNKEQKLEKSIHKRKSYKQNTTKIINILDLMLADYLNRLEEHGPSYIETDLGL